MKNRIRLIWRKGGSDANGQFVGFEYKSDVIDLPDNAHAFEFWGVKDKGWMPELIGGEWLPEETEDDNES